MKYFSIAFFLFSISLYIIQGSNCDSESFCTESALRLTMINDFDFQLSFSLYPVPHQNPKKEKDHIFSFNEFNKNETFKFIKEPKLFYIVVDKDNIEECFNRKQINENEKKIGLTDICKNSINNFEDTPKHPINDMTLIYTNEKSLLNGKRNSLLILNKNKNDKNYPIISLKYYDESSGDYLDYNSENPENENITKILLVIAYVDNNYVDLTKEDNNKFQYKNQKGTDLSIDLDKNDQKAIKYISSKDSILMYLKTKDYYSTLSKLIDINNINNSKNRLYVYRNKIITSFEDLKNEFIRDWVIGQDEKIENKNYLLMNPVVRVQQNKLNFDYLENLVNVYIKIRLFKMESESRKRSPQNLPISEINKKIKEISFATSDYEKSKEFLNLTDVIDLKENLMMIEFKVSNLKGEEIYYVQFVREDKIYKLNLDAKEYYSFEINSGTLIPINQDKEKIFSTGSEYLICFDEEKIGQIKKFEMIEVKEMEKKNISHFFFNDRINDKKSIIEVI